MTPPHPERSAIQVRFPCAQLPRVRLGRWPSAVRQLSDRLFCLDEGECSPDYGGNKVRKLEHILGCAPAASDVITIGAAGSHHVLATAIHSATCGKRTHALLVPQPDTAHVRATLRRSLLRCASLTPTTPSRLLPAMRALSTQLHRETGRAPLIVPVGGSSLEGVFGWISGGLEIAAAVRAGVMPKPARIYTALGSGGTAAGLLIGLRLAGLHSIVVGVRVVDRPLGHASQIHALAQATLHQLRACGATVPPLKLRGLRVLEDWRGGGYGVVTPRIAAILPRAAALGLSVETTYTARCLGAVLADQDTTRAPSLYINTKNTQPLPAGPPLPHSLLRLLT